VGEDTHGTLDTLRKSWAERGLPTEGALVRYSHRIDNMPEATYERRSTPCITPPVIEIHGVLTAAGDIAYDIDVTTI